MVKWKTVIIVMALLLLVISPAIASATVHGLGVGAREAICNNQVVK